MPAWQPNWQDVRFGFSQVEDAADACERLAHLIEQTRSQRRHRGEQALTEWRGHHADEFREYLHRSNGEASDLATELRQTATRLRSGADRARAEQRSRDAGRLEWRRQKFLEDIADLFDT